VLEDGRKRRILGRPVERAHWRLGLAEQPRRDLDGREMTAYQDHAAPTGERPFEMRDPLELREAADTLVARPPAQRHLAHADSDACEVALQEPGALVRIEFGETELEIAARDANVGDRQEPEQHADHAPHPQQRGIRQEANHPQRAVTEPGGPVFRAEQRER